MIAETRTDFDTPDPQYIGEPIPTSQRLTDPRPVKVMAHHEKARMRAAAARAIRMSPGPVGELVSKELLCWADFGYVLGGDGLIMRLVDHVMKAEFQR